MSEDKREWLLTVTIILLCLLFFINMAAAESLTWDPDPSLEYYQDHTVGYKVFFKITQDCNYETEYKYSVDVGNQLSLDLLGNEYFMPGRKYKFQVASYAFVNDIIIQSRLSEVIACVHPKPLTGIDTLEKQSLKKKGDTTDENTTTDNAYEPVRSSSNRDRGDDLIHTGDSPVDNYGEQPLHPKIGYKPLGGYVADRENRNSRLGGVKSSTHRGADHRPRHRDGVHHTTASRGYAVQTGGQNLPDSPRGIRVGKPDSRNIQPKRDDPGFFAEGPTTSKENWDYTKIILALGAIITAALGAIFIKSKK